MKQLVSYLTFNGNCREAMEFYRECLGGELRFQSLEESPGTENLPPPLKKFVVQAWLKNDFMLLMGTDMVGDDGLIRGNAVSILLDSPDEQEIRTYYSRLAHLGKATHPMKVTPGGHLFGGLTDRYGNHWLFRCRAATVEAGISSKDP